MASTDLLATAPGHADHQACATTPHEGLGTRQGILAGAEPESDFPERGNGLRAPDPPDPACRSCDCRATSRTIRVLPTPPSPCRTQTRRSSMASGEPEGATWRRADCTSTFLPTAPFDATAGVYRQRLSKYRPQGRTSSLGSGRTRTRLGTLPPRRRSLRVILYVDTSFLPTAKWLWSAS